MNDQEVKKEDCSNIVTIKNIEIKTWLCNVFVILFSNKLALLWGEAQKKIAYCYPKVT